MTASKDRIEEVVDLYNELENRKATANQMGLALSTVKRYLRKARDLGLLDKTHENYTKDKVEVRHDKNTAVASSKSERIKTLDDLIEETDIDLDKWEIEKHTVNKWNGQKEGGEPVKLYQVKAWLTKKVLSEKEFEPVKPISLNYEYDEPNEPSEEQKEYINDIKNIDPFNISLEKAMEISRKTGLPFHPKYIFFWNQIEAEEDLGVESFLNFIKWLKNSRVEGKIIFPFNKEQEEEFKKAKRVLEILGVKHTAAPENVVVDKETSKALLTNLGINPGIVDKGEKIYLDRKSVVRERV